LEHTHKHWDKSKEFTFGEMGVLVFRGVFDIQYWVVLPMFLLGTFNESRYVHWIFHTLASIPSLMDHDFNFYYWHLSFD